MGDSRGAFGSAANRINGERLVLLGWPRAILMQIAHPLVAAGVCEHSSFRENAVAPIRRLHATVRAMLGLTFGDAAERARTLAGIRSIHTRVHGTLRHSVGRYPAGSSYSAEDPALLLWVHATLIDTTVTLYESAVAELSPEDRDAYCRESADVAVALGADRDAVPQDWPAMKRYVDEVMRSDTLAVGADALALARSLLHSRVVSMTGPVAWATRQLTAGLLPATLRDQYGLPWDSRQQVRFTRLIRTLKSARRLTPAPIARWRVR